MRIDNVHSRELPVPVEHIRTLVDGLASPEDRLWPSDTWPPMCFDRPLGVGADGGHGPIRYAVVDHRPGERVECEFSGPPGLTGRHWLELTASRGGTTVRHVIHARGSAGFMPLWWLMFRWLHDALTDDLLDRAELAATGSVASPNRWSLWVRWLRWLRTSGRRGRRSPGTTGPKPQSPVPPQPRT